MSASDFLAEQKRLAEAATPGPWAFASAPAEGSQETAAEYLESALTGDGPLFVVWVPATEGEPGGYRLTAATGDGPHASMDAEFIAAARSSVPKLVAALEAARRITADYPESTVSFQIDNAIEAALLGGEGDA